MTPALHALRRRLNAQAYDLVNEELARVDAENEALRAENEALRTRLPYIDPLNHLQIELIRRRRAGDSDEAVREGIHLTINGVAAGLRNSG